MSCFNCYGPSKMSNDVFLRSEQNFNNLITNDDQNKSDHSFLFGYSFHKGHSLIYDIPILFKMAKYV